MLFETDVFDSFRDQEGEFNEHLCEDINGLIALYEASQVSIPGEVILDKARNFSKQVLNAKVKYPDNYQARAVENSIANPYHKSLARFMAKCFINNFQCTNGWLNDYTN